MLMAQEAFLKAIQEQPEDDAPRLMYADWLTERGDPRGEFLRVQCELAHTTPGQLDGRRLAQRERELLVEHCTAWLGPLAPHLSSESAPFHRGLLRADLCRSVAEKVVRSSGTNEVLTQIAQYIDEPLIHDYLACLLQELVMKLGEVKGPEVDRLSEKLRAMDHPLALLPPHLVELEQMVVGLALLSEEDLSRERRRPSRRTRPSAETPYPLPARGHSSVDFREITTPTEAKRIASAVLSWERSSHGAWAAGVFRAMRPLRVDRLSLDALQMLPVEFQPIESVRAVPARRAWWELFDAARGGYHSAYGRLQAWRSFTALMGASLTANLNGIARQANDVCWLTFETDWFHGDGGELGLAAVRNDGRTVAMLAATC